MSPTRRALRAVILSHLALTPRRVCPKAVGNSFVSSRTAGTLPSPRSFPTIFGFGGDQDSDDRNLIKDPFGRAPSGIRGSVKPRNTNALLPDGEKMLTGLLEAARPRSNT